MKPLKLACVVAAVAIITLPTAALAASYNAVGDFNTTNKIADTWTYGTKSVPDGPLTLLSNFTTNSILFGNGNTQNWYYHTGSAGTGGPCPAEGCEGFGPFIAKNTSAGTLGASGVTFPNSVLMITPGDPLSAPAGPPMTVVRWTSPASSAYDISGAFINLQQATTSLYVVVNGVVAQLPGLSSGLQANTISFNNILVNAGGTVDFVVSSRGAGEPLGPGIQYFDPVGLSVTIQSAVPEPSMVALFCVGLLGLLFRSKRQANSRTGTAS